MPLNLLLASLLSKGNINDNDKLLVSNFFKETDVQKNKILLSRGDISSKIYFVVSGALRVFYTTEKGKEVSRLIVLENQFCTSLSSFKNQTPSIEYIQVLENSKLMCINHSDFNNLLSLSPNIDKIYRSILEEIQISQVYRMESLAFTSSKEKVLFVKKHNDILLNRLSNKILASYIGLTEETLSRIKKTLNL